MQNDQREAVARIIDPSAFLFSPDELPKGSRAQFDAFDRADRILALLSTSPLALGGQQGDSETLRVLLDNLVIAQTLSKDIRQKATDEACSYLYDRRTTPARAEAQDEGAAGEQTDNAFKIASDLHAAYEQLIYGLPKYLEAENLTDEENMIREAYITLDVTAHRLAAVSDAHPSPPPAADEDRARIAVEALEPFAAFAQVAEAKSRMALGEVLPDDKILASISWEGGLGVLVMGHFRDALSLAPNPKGWSGLYRRSDALKSTAAKEGGAV